MARLSHGMNTDAVREQASKMDHAANDLRSFDSSIGRVIAGLEQQWHGSDFAMFKSWWRDQHKPTLLRLVESIEGLAASARHEAAEQDRVSETKSGAVGNDQGVASRIDSGKVARAYVAVQAALDTGGLGVRRDDLLAIDSTFRALNDGEQRALFEKLTDSELAILKDQMQESRAKGGLNSAQQAAFLGMLLPAIDIGAARELMGPEWALQRHKTPDPIAPATTPAGLSADLLDGLRGQFNGQDYGSRIASDEIEIRRLDNGSYIVLLPGVQDLRDGLTSPNGWERINPTDSARDMHYARQSEMQSDNGSANGTNAYAFAVKEAMRVNGIPDGANVMLVGHSFGAYTAVEMATDPGFNEAMERGGQGNYSVNVTHVVAAGASVAFRMDDLPRGTSGVLLNNADDVAYLGEQQLPTNKQSSDREIVFDGSQYPDRAGRVNDGHGHEPSNYGAFVRSVNLDQVTTFNESAFSRYGGSGEAFRVTVKDPYR